MAADNEIRLLSRAIRDRDIRPIMDRGITDDWFENRDAREIWTFVRRHYSKYAEVPTAVTVTDNYPTIPLLKVNDTIDYLLDQFVAYRRNRIAHDTLKEAVQVFKDDNDHEAALAILTKGIAAADGVLQSDRTHEFDLTDDPLARLKDYRDLKQRGTGLLGHATGFPTMDEATGGLQGGQLVFIVAPPKTGKSVLALQMATTNHKNDLTPWFQSWEMVNREQQTRHDAFRAGISHAHLIRGGLETWEETQYEKMLRDLTLRRPFYLADSSHGMTVPAIISKVSALNPIPDVIYLDGTYFIVDHMSGEVNTPRAITSVTRSLKAFAIKIDRPIVATTQALEWKMKGSRVTAGSIGYASSFHQDADVIFGLERPDDDDDRVRRLRIIASRNCGPAEADLVWDWSRGRFEEYAAEDENE